MFLSACCGMRSGDSGEEGKLGQGRKRAKHGQGGCLGARPRFFTEHLFYSPVLVFVLYTAFLHWLTEI